MKALPARTSSPLRDKRAIDSEGIIKTAKWKRTDHSPPEQIALDLDAPDLVAHNESRVPVRDLACRRNEQLRLCLRPVRYALHWSI